jgi:hypothetical protein
MRTLSNDGTTRIAGLAVCLILCGRAASAQTPTPTMARGEEHLMEPPTDQQSGGLAPSQGRIKSTPKTTSQTVTVPGAPPDSSHQESANVGALKGIRAVQLNNASGRVRLADGTEQDIKLGDTLAGDKVVQIIPGRIVLNRAEGGGQNGIVIVQFDAQGNSRVQVLMAHDPNSTKAPAVQ